LEVSYSAGVSEFSGDVEEGVRRVAVVRPRRAGGAEKPLAQGAAWEAASSSDAMFNPPSMEGS